MVQSIQTVLHVGDFDDPKSVHQVHVTSKTADGMFWKGKKSAEYYGASNVFPVSAFHAVIEMCTERQRLKKAYDDSSKLIYELRNAVARGEYK